MDAPHWQHDRPVLVVSAAGCWVGLLGTLDGTTATLTRARHLVKYRDDEYWGDLATRGPSVREAQVTDLIEGPVLLTGVSLVAPLSGAAQKRICRASEDRLPIKPAD